MNSLVPVLFGLMMVMFASTRAEDTDHLCHLLSHTNIPINFLSVTRIRNHLILITEQHTVYRLPIHQMNIHSHRLSMNVPNESKKKKKKPNDEGKEGPEDPIWMPFTWMGEDEYLFPREVFQGMIEHFGGQYLLTSLQTFDAFGELFWRTETKPDDPLIYYTFRHNITERALTIYAFLNAKKVAYFKMDVMERINILVRIP